MKSNKIIFSSLIFFTGIALGLALAVALIWPDYEAVRYFFTGAVYGPFRGMTCPPLAARSETTTISAAIGNTTDQVVKPVYKVDVSGPLGRESREQISIPPHQTQHVEWTVTADDIDLGSFILSKITVLSYPGSRAREATCGILVLNVAGLSGKTILNISLALSLLGILVGLFVWEGQVQTISQGFIQPQRVRRALAVAVLLALLAGLMSWWIAGILFVVLSVLLVVLALFRG